MQVLFLFTRVITFCIHRAFKLFSDWHFVFWWIFKSLLNATIGFISAQPFRSCCFMWLKIIEPFYLGSLLTHTYLLFRKYICIHVNYLIIWKDYGTKIVKLYKMNIIKLCRALYERKCLSDYILLVITYIRLDSKLIHANFNYLAE